MRWKSAIIASGVVASIATVMHQVLATGGTYYFAQVDWTVVNELPYAEAQKYLTERSKDLSKVQSLKNSLSHPYFWLNGAIEFLVLWGLGLTSCFIYGRGSQT
tara:strand:+ start:62 stop:370 length:309 start_codon:yes stop_codon:yes gene_type:complete